MIHAVSRGNHAVHRQWQLEAAFISTSLMVKICRVAPAIAASPGSHPGVQWVKCMGLTVVASSRVFVEPAATRSPVRFPASTVRGKGLGLKGHLLLLFGYLLGRFASVHLLLHIIITVTGDIDFFVVALVLDLLLIHG